jgi:hypothetical protein
VPELVDNPLPVICHGTSLVLDGQAELTDPGLKPWWHLPQKGARAGRYWALG